MTPLVSTEWLAQHLDDADVRVVDVRWYLFDKDKRGYDEYLRGHIPGAVFLDIDQHLAAPPGSGPGRHPLPSPEIFAEHIARAGITHNTHVIAYDDAGGATAGRLWWLLRYFGHHKVSLLDGGINCWIAEGRPLETMVPRVPRGEFVARPNADWVVSKENIIAMQNDPRALVLDSRAAERYEGKVEPIDARPGHIPGAKHAPFADNLRAPTDPRFRESPELRVRFEELGASEAERVVVYCGSGINACQNIFALHLAGYDNALLYEGSWSDWSRDPDLPAASGPNP